MLNSKSKGVLTSRLPMVAVLFARHAVAPFERKPRITRSTRFRASAPFRVFHPLSVLYSQVSRLGLASMRLTFIDGVQLTDLFVRINLPVWRADGFINSRLRLCVAFYRDCLFCYWDEHRRYKKLTVWPG